MIVRAANWKGAYLPWGAAGMPASHPEAFAYAEPRWIPGRGIGRYRRRGIGQASTSPVWTASCNPGTVDACSWTDWLFGTSAACAAGLQQCFYAANAPGASAGLNLSNPPSAGPISTAELVAQTAAPTGSNVAPDAAAALTAYQAAVAAANTCPAGTVAQSNGTCAAPSSGVPWWAWAVGGGLLLLAVAK